MNHTRHVGINTFFLLISLLFSSASHAVLVSVPERQPGYAAVHKTGSMARVGTRLAQLVRDYQAHVSRGDGSAFIPADKSLQFSNGRVLVDATTASRAGLLLDDLRGLGLRNGESFGRYVSGLLPVAAIQRAASLQSLQSITASLPPIRNAGSVTSQGDVALRSDIARSSYGVAGDGVTVGVLSDSYDMLGGAAADVTDGELPAAGVGVLSESSLCSLVGCVDEGRAMLQIVHDIAPGASLLFHTGLGGVAAYANGITSLASAGADVIVDDLMYLTEPMFMDGAVAQAVDAVTASGVAYFSAAGNQGRQSYESAFVDSGEDLCIDFIPDGVCDPIFELVGDMHDFDPGPGVDYYQQVTVPVGDVLIVAFQWDEPHGNVNTGDGPRSDHDILLLDETGGVMIEISADDNVTTGAPTEVLQYVNDGLFGSSFNIVLTFDDIDSPGPAASLMKTVLFGNAIAIDDFPTDSATLFGHANAASAEAVGAAFYLETPEYGIAPPMLESFSAAGGTPILFDENGDPLPTPVVRAKPELVAVDGVNTSFFYLDTYGADGIPDFFGTSAAAPHAAGIAALMLEAGMGASPDQVYGALEQTAIDMGEPGFDHDSGYGLIQADSAINALMAVDNLSPVADFSFSVDGLVVDFADLSSDADGDVVSWNWDFGDGDGSTDSNPSHTYPTDGSYTVTLNVIDDGGATGATSQIVSVAGGPANVAPLAYFSYVCVDTLCAFDASGSTDDTGIVAYAWDFGDGVTDSGVTPEHEYSTHGTYTVTLSVTDSDDATGTASVTFRVKNRGTVSGDSGGVDDGGSTGGGGAEKGPKKCSDGEDNDGDGLIDAADTDCA